MRENERRHELVGLASFVLSIQRFRWRIFARFTATENNCVPSFFRPIPATIAIHREITTDNSDNFRAARTKLLLANFQIFAAAGWRRIAAVGERVHKNFRHARFLGGVGKRDHVVVMTVHAAVRNEA